MFSWDLTQGRPGHSAVSSLQSSHPSQPNVDLQRPREELRDSSDISPQLSCLAASQVGLVVARTDQQQLVGLVLPDVCRVVSDVYRMGTGSVRSVSYEETEGRRGGSHGRHIWRGEEPGRRVSESEVLLRSGLAVAVVVL